MKNKINDGLSFVHAPAAAVSSGDVLLQGNTVGIAVKDLAIGESGVFETEGVFECVKLTADVVALGDQLYWDDGNGRWTKTASTHKGKGIAYEAADGTVSLVKVKINKAM